MEVIVPEESHTEYLTLASGSQSPTKIISNGTISPWNIKQMIPGTHRGDIMNDRILKESHQCNHILLIIFTSKCAIMLCCSWDAQ